MYTKEEIENQLVIDKKTIDSYWKNLEENIEKRSNKQIAKKIREAFEEYYEDMYGVGDIPEWLAGLYDPQIGGFYYSNSARDNEGFLPDLESTRQAIKLFHILGVPEYFGKNIPDVYTEEFKKKVLEFVKVLQDENGYFYHPQWPRELTDSKPHRRGRDLNWACELFQWFGDSPTYDTPTGLRGNGILADGTIAKNYVPREKGEIAAPKEELVTPHLKNKDAFLEYLDTFDLNGNSYVVASRFESESREIYARDKVLSELGEDYSLCDILKSWFDERQDVKTGLWTLKSPDIDGLNGLLKACGAYNGIHRSIPNGLRGIESAIEVLNSGEDTGSVCHVLNPWYAINSIITNMALYGGGASEAEKYKLYIFEHAPEMIRSTKNHIIQYKKPDGSFSFAKMYSSHLSQGHPVAVPNTYEGDVNATNIAAQGIIGHIFDLLEVKRVPVYGKAAIMKFYNIIEGKS